MTDIAELGFRIRSNEAVQATRNLDRMTAASGRAQKGQERLQRSSTRTNASMGALSRSAGSVSPAMGGMSNSLRMAGLQLNQVAQQGAITGDYFRALAFQMPDLLIGFGTLGVFAGIAAGALTPLITNLAEAHGEVTDFEDALESLGDIMDTLQRPLDVLDANMVDLVATYGSAASTIRELARAEQELAAAQARRNLSRISIDLSDQLTIYAGINDRVRENRGAVNRLTRDLGVTADQARVLERQFSALSDAEGIDVLADELLKTDDLLQQMGVSLADLPEGMQDSWLEAVVLAREIAAVEQAIADTNEAVEGTERALQQSNQRLSDMYGLYANVRIQAQSLADENERARDALLQVMSMQNRGDAMQASGGRGDGLAELRRRNGGADPLAGEFVYDGPRLDANNQPIVREPRGSGGQTKEQQEHLRLQRQAQQIFDDTRTAVEAYNIEMEELNTLHREGYISADTLMRAADQLAEGFATAARESALLDNMAAQTFSGIITGAESASDAVRNLLGNLADMAITAGFQGLLGNTLTGAFGVAFGMPGNADGTDYWRGGLTWVGERGPELVNVPRGAQIHSAEASRGMVGGTSVTVNAPVTVNVADSSASPEAIAGALSARVLPQFERLAVSAVKDAQRRSRF